MSMTTGQQQLIDHVVTMSDRPNIALPNGPGADLPRYVVQVAGGRKRTFDLSGAVEKFPEIVIRVETEDGDLATENDPLVAALEARFSLGSRFDDITILEDPDVRPPLRGGGVYAVPVIIRGRFFPTN